MRKLIPSIVNDRLNYDPSSGIFLWKKENKSHPRLTGKPAGCVVGNYHVIKINGVSYRAHRIAWFMSTGEQPDVIDHINGDGLDNRISNLRNVSFSENAKNHGRSLKDAELPCGVRVLPSGNYQARITCDGSIESIGAFDDPGEAQKAYLNRRKELFAEYSRG